MIGRDDMLILVGCDDQQVSETPLTRFRLMTPHYRERWLQALSIDPETGLDPSGFKVRAARGLDAAVSDFFKMQTPRKLTIYSV